MSSGVLSMNPKTRLNIFRLTGGVKSARESAVFRSDPRHCGAGNTLAVLSRRNDAEAGGRARSRECSYAFRQTARKNDASPDIRKGEKTKMRRYGSLRTSILTYLLYNVCNFSKYYKVLTFSRADKSRRTPPFSRLRRREHRRYLRGHACPPLPKRRLAAFRANRRRAAK